MPERQPASVAEAGLRSLEGVYLVELERDGTRMFPVGPDQRLEGDDRLIFAGDVQRIVDLQRIDGLRSAEEHHFSVVADSSDRCFYEVVVLDGSRLVGTNLKDAGFRERYGGAVMAIRRAGGASSATWRCALGTCCSGCLSSRSRPSASLS